MIDELKRNIDTEIEMLREIVSYMNSAENARPVEKKVLNSSIASVKQSMKLINSSIPNILANISVAKKLSSGVKPTGLEKINIGMGAAVKAITLNTGDKEKFLKEVSISEKLIRGFKKRENVEKEIYGEFRAARGYLKYANRFFLKTSQDLTKKGYFAPLSKELKKANIDVLFETYVAMIFLTTTISIIAALFAVVFLTFFNLGLTLPIISLHDGSYLYRIASLIWLPFVLPIATFLTLYYYPSTERKSLASRIDQELPFAVIYMSAISGAGIEPTEIFKIIGANKEYPFLRREIRKVLNQINIYGYDLITSLNNVSKTTPSTKLAELFSGISVTTSSGGSLSEFFEKRAETLLLSYRLERENYTRIAETFMDIYISVVIATPMILMLLLIVLSISAPGMGLSPNMLTIIIASAVAIVNVFFLVFLQIKQPSY